MACLFIFTAVVLTGCMQYVAPPSAGLPGGVTHQVARGETLWRIARRYDVELDDLVRANRISDASRVKVGQTLLIPSASSGAGSPRAQEILPETGPQGAPERPAVWEDFIWPVEGKVISIFGMRQAGAVNKGIDIQSAPGTEVLAARGGQVSFVHERLPGFGKTIILDHGNGFATVYAYIGEILVRPGEKVSQQQVIARVGRTGRSEVPALHFEIRRNQRPQNPFYYLP